MDLSKKIVTDAQNVNEPTSEHSSGSSSSNDSSDPSSRASRPDKFQDLTKSSKTTVTKGTVCTKITEVASTNISQDENHKSSTMTTNVSSNEEESRVEISGRRIGPLTFISKILAECRQTSSRFDQTSRLTASAFSSRSVDRAYRLLCQQIDDRADSIPSNYVNRLCLISVPNLPPDYVKLCSVSATNLLA